MGLETVIETFRGIVGPFAKLFEGISPAATAATAGLIILLFMAGFYAIYGLVKLGKLVWNLRVKSVTVGLTLLGVVLIALAVLLPY
ncbi:MAG: hypothetical protein QXZ60_01680 [Sulfolobales archaeon]